MAEVISLAEVSDDGLLWSPLDALRAALRDYESGELRGNKLIVIALDDQGCYDTSYIQSGMKCSEIVALCEAIKTRMLKELVP